MTPAHPPARLNGESLLDALESGEVRVAERKGDDWVVHGWVKEAILDLFRGGKKEIKLKLRAEVGPLEEALIFGVTWRPTWRPWPPSPPCARSPETFASTSRGGSVWSRAVPRSGAGRSWAGALS